MAGDFKFSNIYEIIHVLFLLLPCLTCFQLEGSHTSYAKFPPWNPCMNGSIKFEFKTLDSEGLLLYMDDGGQYDYVEIKLVSGMLRLRIHIGEHELPLILTQGFRLHDNQWHQVQISISGRKMTYKVDNLQSIGLIHGEDLQFGNEFSNGFMFVGGLPIIYHTKLWHLSLPSVVFEQHFNGSVRNLLYSDCGQSYESVRLVDSEGVRNNVEDPCQERNPCLNQGICISTDLGTRCDCSATHYQGGICETGTYM